MPEYNVYTQEETFELLETVVAMGEDLTDWEQQFLDSLYHIDRNFTLPEHRKVTEIYRKRCRA